MPYNYLQVSKNIQILIVSAIMLLILGGTGGYVFYKYKDDPITTKDFKIQSAKPAQNTQDPLALAPQADTPKQVKPQDTSGSSLSVTNNQASGGLQSNLGQQPANTNSTSKAPTQVPGPETFGQYNQYKDAQNGLFGDIVIGTGTEAVAGKKVAMLYKGWLTDGQLFDQTKPNEDNQMVPFVFELGAGKVIPGWEQTIEGMKVGGKRRLIIPPVAGYGAQGQGPIPPNAVLVFDVELVSVL